MAAGMGRWGGWRGGSRRRGAEPEAEPWGRSPPRVPPLPPPRANPAVRPGYKYPGNCGGPECGRGARGRPSPAPPCNQPPPPPALASPPLPGDRQALKGPGGHRGVPATPKPGGDPNPNLHPHPGNAGVQAAPKTPPPRPGEPNPRGRRRWEPNPRDPPQNPLGCPHSAS